MEIFQLHSEGNGFNLEPGPLLYIFILIYILFWVIFTSQAKLKLRTKSVTLKLPFDTGDVELELDEREQHAAWSLYVEMSTRIATQELPDDVGSDKAALDSLNSLYATSRELLKGIAPIDIAKAKKSFGVFTLNLMNGDLRQFLSKWHPQVVNGEIPKEKHVQFRLELAALQMELAPVASGLRVFFGKG